MFAHKINTHSVFPLRWLQSIDLENTIKWIARHLIFIGRQRQSEGVKAEAVPDCCPRQCGVKREVSWLRLIIIFHLKAILQLGLRAPSYTYSLSRGLEVVTSIVWAHLLWYVKQDEVPWGLEHPSTTTIIWYLMGINPEWKNTPMRPIHHHRCTDQMYVLSRHIVCINVIYSI